MGLLGELSLTSKWNVQSELLYSEQGYTLSSNNASSADLEVDLNYLQLPVLTEFGITKGLALQAGPQLSYLLNKETLLSNGGNGRVFNYNSFDLSLAFGAEYEFQHFFLFGRYHAGLNRIVNASDIQTHNLVIQAGIGFLF